MKAMAKLLPVLMMMVVTNPTLAADDGIKVPKALSMPIETGLTFEERFIRIILPPNVHASHSKRLPLVLHLHGSIPDPNVPELELDNSGYRHLPGKYKVIVAAPSGTLHPDTGFYFWNATEACCGFEPTFGEQVDDAGFLNRLLDKLLEDYPIAPRRVYIYGYSNGAFMAYRMACDYAERFAAIAVGAGVTFNDPDRCAPSSPVSVLHFHSMEDEVVLFNGGNLGFLVGEPENPVYDYPGAIETVAMG